MAHRLTPAAGTECEASGNLSHESHIRGERLAHFVRLTDSMTKLIRDPQLEQLVRELNDAQPPADDARAAPVSWPQPEVGEGNRLESLLVEMAQRGASDLLLVVNLPPVFRLAVRLTRAS